MNEVTVNGFTYYADIRNRILYDDKEKTSGIPFSYLTKNELEQVQKELRFPRSKKTV
jgi:hypothetical protein